MAGSTHTAENGGGAVGTKPARGDDLHQGSGEHRFPWLLRLPVLCSALVQVSTLVYLNSLDGGIVYDDKPVLRNPDVTGARPLSAMWYHDFWGYAMWGDSWTHLSYRPLVVLTLRLNRMTGLGLPGMHATNIAIHAGVVILALFLCMALFPSSRRAEAAAAALLFAVHPIHTEVVANITGRAETVSAALVLGALLCYHRAIRSRRRRAVTVQGGGQAQGSGATTDFTARVVAHVRRLQPTGAEAAWVAASCALTGAAVLCKETALVTPALVGVLEAAAQLKYSRREDGGGKAGDAAAGVWAVLGHSHLRRIAHAIRDALSTGRMVLGLAFGVAMLWFRIVFLAGGYQLKFSPVSNSLADAPAGLPRFLSAAYVQSKAAKLLVWTVGQAHEHTPVAPVLSLLDVRNIQTLLFWAFLAVVLHVCLFQGSRRAQARRLVAIGLIVIPYLPASHMLFAVAFVVAERTLFLPSLGLTILVAEGLFTVARWTAVLLPRAWLNMPWTQHAAALAAPRTQAVSPRRNRRGAAILIAALLVTMTAVPAAVVTVRRNGAWKNEFTLLRSTLKQYPMNPMSLYGMGWALELKDWPLSAFYLARAALAREAFADPMLSLAETADKEGDAARAVRLYKRALRYGERTGYATNVFAVGWLTDEIPKEEAEWYALAAHARNYFTSADRVGLAVVANNAGVVRATGIKWTRDLDIAADLFMTYVKMHPTLPHYGMYNLACTRLVQRQYDAAERSFQITLDYMKGNDKMDDMLAARCRRGIEHARRRVTCDNEPKECLIGLQLGLLASKLGWRRSADEVFDL